MKEVNLNRVRKQPCWVETPRTPCYRRGQARVTVAPTWQCCAEDKNASPEQYLEAFQAQSNCSESASVRICDG